MAHFWLVKVEGNGLCKLAQFIQKPGLVTKTMLRIIRSDRQDFFDLKALFFFNVRLVCVHIETAVRVRGR